MKFPRNELKWNVYCVRKPSGVRQLLQIPDHSWKPSLNGPLGSEKLHRWRPFGSLAIRAVNLLQLYCWRVSLGREVKLIARESHHLTSDPSPAGDSLSVSTVWAVVYFLFFFFSRMLTKSFLLFRFLCFRSLPLVLSPSLPRSRLVSSLNLSRRNLSDGEKKMKREANQGISVIV